MTRKIISLIVAFLTLLTPSIAQKELKNLRAFVKAKNTTEAMKEVARLESDSTCQHLLEVYELALKTQIQINDVENEKVYLKKACDTVKLFESTRQIFFYIKKTDSLNRAEKADNGKTYKQEKSKEKLIERYYSNFVAGTRYFYARKMYKEAQRNLDLLLQMNEGHLIDDDLQDEKAKDVAMNAYMFTYCAFHNADYANVERYKNLLFADQRYYQTTLEMYARAANSEGDSEKFEKYLEQGVTDFPLHAYFFDELATLYVTDERYAQCVDLADHVLAADSVSLKAMYLKAHALFKTDKQVECIEISKKLVEADTHSTYAEANYYAGLFIMNKLETIYLPTRIGSKDFVRAKNEMKKVCSEARPYLERYRKLCPSQHAQWAPLLYKVYLELNMGPEFEDISRYM